MRSGPFCVLETKQPPVQGGESLPAGGEMDRLSPQRGLQNLISPSPVKRPLIQRLTVLEKTLMTATPATMRPMPSMAGKSRCCLWTITPARAMSTMPNPAQMA